MKTEFKKGERFNIRVSENGFDCRIISKDEVNYTEISKEEAERIYEFLKTQLGK